MRIWVYCALIERKMMKKDELIEKLKEIKARQGYEGELYLCAEEAHWIADELLIKFINDSEVEKCFNDIKKWYS